jgi:hypothetical protein
MKRKILVGIFTIFALLVTLYLLVNLQNLGNFFYVTTKTFTEVPTSASTPLFTFTNTVTPVFAETLRPTLPVAEQASISALETKVSEYPSICKNTLPYYFSPNELWREEFCVSEIDKKLVLTISNRETKVLWRMIYRDYVPKSDFLPDGEMSVSRWSNDGKYAYFNSYSNGSGADVLYRTIMMGVGDCSDLICKLAI